MYANEYRVLVNAVEDGVRSGIRKAWKHDDSQPPSDDQVDLIIDYVVNSILEWFHLNSEQEHLE